MRVLFVRLHGQAMQSRSECFPFELWPSLMSFSASLSFRDLRQRQRCASLTGPPERARGRLTPDETNRAFESALEAATSLNGHPIYDCCSERGSGQAQQLVADAQHRWLRFLGRVKGLLTTTAGRARVCLFGPARQPAGLAAPPAV